MLGRSTLWLGAAAVLAASGSVWASESSEEFAQLGAPITQGALDERRAREGRLEFNLQENNANLNNNVAAANTTGSNFMTEGAFSQNSGLPVAVQNSGNNVIIQNAFIINLDVK